VQQLRATSATAAATLHNVASNGIHAVNVVIVLKAKVKASAVMAVVATHAVAVVVNVRVNVVPSARLSVVTNHVLIRVTSLVTNHAQRVVQKAVMSHAMKVVVRVQTVATNAMSRALMQKATKLLQII
jgi:hypothetical protein